MTLRGFSFILASALFHVLWNTGLKASRDKPSAILLMMVVTVLGFCAALAVVPAPENLFRVPVIISALAAGFFFFLYQYCVARSYENGDLTLVYPLTVTGPIYIVLWSHLLLGERVSATGVMGVLCIVYGAVTLQTGSFRIAKRLSGLAGMRNTGALFALAAGFFYSFGAVADKFGVMDGDVTLYTLYLCIFMLIFHLVRMIAQGQTGSVLSEMKHSPWVVLAGGTVMLLSFITFRIGLAEALASYASALRQVSTLFGLAIGYAVFKERLTPERIMSSCLIVAGAVLIKMG